MRWMNLEPITQSEVCQKEKDKYYVLTYVWNLDDTDAFICKAAMEKQTQRTDLWTQERGKEGETMERVTWKLTLPRVTAAAAKSLQPCPTL